MITIDITGIDHGILFTLLHNGSKAVRMGKLHEIPNMTIEQGKAIWDKGGPWSPTRGTRVPGEWPVKLDYVFGRPIKVTLHEKTLDWADAYDNDTGPDDDIPNPGHCQRVVDEARRLTKVP